MEEFIEYENWITGEKIRHILSDSHPAERKTKVICPFDNTPLLFWYDQYSYSGLECVNCGMQYSTGGLQGSINKQFKEHIAGMREEIFNLDQRRKDLVEKLNYISENDSKKVKKT
jgi:hypothetical protein